MLCNLVLPSCPLAQGAPTDPQRNTCVFATPVSALPSTSTCRYWYPLSYFGSLAFQPTAFIGLNSDLQLPQLEATCAIRPSVFAYPPPVSQQENKEVGACFRFEPDFPRLAMLPRSVGLTTTFRTSACIFDCSSHGV